MDHRAWLCLHQFLFTDTLLLLYLTLFGNKDISVTAKCPAQPDNSPVQKKVTRNPVKLKTPIVLIQDGVSYPDRYVNTICIKL